MTVSHSSDAPRVRFDFADATTLGLPTPLCFERPERVIVCHDPGDVRRAMRAVEDGVREGFYAAGFVAYEAACAFDDALTTPLPRAGLPLVWFALYRRPALCRQPPLCRQPALCREPTRPEPRPFEWTPDVTPAEYRHGVEAIKAAIARGDTYQVNYTFRLHASIAEASDTPDETAALDEIYQRLARTQRAPYSASLDLGRWRILSLSPELFFRVRGRRITTRPMKGTIARGRWAEDDRARRAWLASSEKNRAENVMIVDLARNDVGRIAEIGSVRAVSLFDVECYPTVFQMVSTVEGTLREPTTLTDVFAALFPAGSITGAPKSSSMRTIASVEASPRGVYCGAIGFVTPTGDAIFNVAIRTAVVDTHTGRAEYGVGGGITWDSTTTGEYEEALSKAAVWAASPPFELIETMRLERGVYVRRTRHVQRLRESASHLASCGLFGVDSAANSPASPPGSPPGSSPANPQAIDAALDAHALEHPVETRRARLLLASSGEVRVESVSFGDRDARDPHNADRHDARDPHDARDTDAHGSRDPDGAQPLVTILARTPIARDDRWLYHKTTHRAVHEAHRRERGDAFDVLLWNEAGELTEFTTGNVVVELDGERWTPPRACGLLAGVLRGELLDAGAIRERVVTIDDLARATRVWFINSVRGWIEVEVRADVASATRTR